MTLLVGSWTVGLILAILALGVFISFRIFAFPDITADGSLTLGAAVAAALIVRGYSSLDGHHRLDGRRCARGRHDGRSAHPIQNQRAARRHPRRHRALLRESPCHAAEQHPAPGCPHGRHRPRPGRLESDGSGRVRLASSAAKSGLAMWSTLIAVAVLVAAIGGLLRVFFGTSLGTAMRATGDNQRMIRSLGVNVGRMITLGLMMSNALVALSGAILAQYQGFADIQMGIGMIVWGLASVILGQALVGSGGLGLSISGAVLGSLLFRLMVALALRWGLDPNDLKMVTAAFVFAALVLPNLLAARTRRGARGGSRREAIDHARLLELRGVYKTFNPGTPDGVRALRGIDLTLEPGSYVVVIGTNGSGKSTTLNAVAGSFPVDSGTISLAGKNITRWPEHRRAKLIGRVFQDPLAGTSPTLSIAVNLAHAARRGQPRGLGKAVSRRAVAEFRDRVRPLGMGLEDRLDNPIGSLSGGQRQACRRC